MNTIAQVSLFGVILFIFSCSKGGPGGDKTISGRCIHHDSVIPNDTVYIKYNAKELPGVNPGDYNDHVYADKDGRYMFTGLKKGNYYLYAIGYDSSIAQRVVGGLPVKLKGSDNESIDIHITEGD